MAEIIKKKQIFKIAKELNISHDDIISFLEGKGIKVTSPMMKVDMETYDLILNEFARERQQIDRYRKDQARMAVLDTRRVDSSTNEDSTVKSDIDEKSEAISLSLKERIKAEKQRISEKKKQEKEKQEKEKQEKIDEKNKVDKDKENLRENKNVIDKEEKPQSSLKIVRYATKEEKDKLEKQKQGKTDLKKSKKEKLKKEDLKSEAEKISYRSVKPRKLKKINVASIADKINQTRFGKGASDKKSKKPVLPTFGQKLKKKTKKQKRVETVEVEKLDSKKIIRLPEFTSVDELAQSMDVSVNEVIMSCMSMGLMVTINQRLEMESMMLIADEFGFEIDTIKDVVVDMVELKSDDKDDKNATPRAPVVTVMGHVDHGKTSLLDFVRNDNVVAGEAGGITQHIGAYEVTLENSKKITFLDTPGHAAFTAMRARGAQVTDIVVIIVAADDSVMPQTIEAIDHARAASVPIIVAINKIDRPESNSDKIKQQLTEQKLVVEDYGGNIQCSEISAKTGIGIPELLDKILLEAEMLDLKANAEISAKGTVIESRLDKGLGAVATVLVEKGTLRKGDIFICGTQYSKVRALLNERGVRVESAGPSDPVQVLGFEEVPNAGDGLNVMKDEREARRIALQRSQLKREAEQRRFKHLTLDQIGQQISHGELQNLDIVVKGDVDGSIEALSDALMALSNKEVAVNIIHRSVGMVNENDVTLCTASGAIILAFNVGVSNEAKYIAKQNGIDIRNYSVIYDAVNDVKLALEGLLRPDKIEEALGVAEVRNVFKIGRKDVIAGSYVKNGKAIRNALLRIERDEEIIHEGKLTSLKRFKDDVNEVNTGFECGIAVEGFDKFIEGDLIKFYEIVEVKRTLV
ncbi:MAG: translation initiation factor IF-2 [Candidatus Neomarinimicrobiota bacterium]|nr:translation initiation factor IF-2 [Candidatus Neomarinimicrobiota bacterium]